MSLLLAVVHEAEKLAEAHVVCLRRGVWVSGAASSVRAAPADQCAIVKRQTDFAGLSLTCYVYHCLGRNP